MKLNVDSLKTYMGKKEHMKCVESDVNLQNSCKTCYHVHIP